MRWVAPTEKDTANQTLEKRLWVAAGREASRVAWAVDPQGRASAVQVAGLNCD